MFFFFQAEDGIRDGHVTGVQTCALPILTSVNGPTVEVRPVTTIPNPSRYEAFHLAHQVDHSASSGIIDGPAIHEQMWTDPRSEERRVGKECRSRRWKEREKKRIRDVDGQ